MYLVKIILIMNMDFICVSHVMSCETSLKNVNWHKLVIHEHANLSFASNLIL